MGYIFFIKKLNYAIALRTINSIFAIESLKKRLFLKKAIITMLIYSAKIALFYGII